MTEAVARGRLLNEEDFDRQRGEGIRSTREEQQGNDTGNGAGARDSFADTVCTEGG